IDLSKVPKREPGMTAYEILLSESQERMLIIARRGKENLVREVFDKWDVPCAEIGRVTSDGMMRVRNNGRIAAEIPANALLEAARNLTCSGAKPLAVTDCLNFGNPYKSENFWQFREAVEGIAEACRAVGTPVTGGNVSLYNENPAGVVDPTPTIAMVGLIDDEKHITTQWFKNHGDVIILVGTVVPRGRDDACAGINDPGYN